MAKQLITKLRVRQDTTENWITNKGVVLALGEPAIELTAQGKILFKIGDGNTDWEHLDYQTGNFDAFAQQVNINTEDISSLKGRVSDLETSVGTNTNDITSLKGRMDTAETNIEGLQTATSNLRENVESNTVYVANLLSGIYYQHNLVIEAGDSTSKLKIFATLLNKSNTPIAVVNNAILSKLCSEDSELNTSFKISNFDKYYYATTNYYNCIDVEVDKTTLKITGIHYIDSNANRVEDNSTFDNVGLTITDDTVTLI